MDYVTLAPGLPPSSRLGFGCGSVMGRVGRGPSLRAIAAACDSGISHFDIARLYGYGEAEALVGEALRGRRDRVVIASKFGLVATRAAMALRGLKPLAQNLVARVPALRPLIRSAVGTARGAGRFSPAAAESSLTQSLRALKTDYLDILFLHDADAADLTPELLDFLDRQVAAGRIRAYGIASGAEPVAALYPVHGKRLIYQFGNSLCARNVERLPAGAAGLIGHSPFLGIDRLYARLQAEPGLLRLADGRAVAAADVPPLMLNYALSVEPIAVVLCSMLDTEHLRANLAAAERPPFTAADLAACLGRLRAAEAAASPG